MMLSDVNVGNYGQIEQEISTGLFDKLINIVLQDDEPQVKRESLCALSNATLHATPSQIEVLVAKGLL